jgi:NAD-binding of NADP-dependent 3-hydroxyisobutyrate dehydrogenase
MASSGGRTHPNRPVQPGGQAGEDPRPGLADSLVRSAATTSGNAHSRPVANSPGHHLATRSASAPSGSGEVGAGSRLKLVNNTLVAFAAEAVATSVALAGRLGLATETVIQALGGGPLVSPWQAAKLARIANGEFSAQFALSLALKDVRLALQAADEDRLAALACLAEEWQQAVDQGLGDQDLTVVTRVLEQQEGGVP